MLYTFNRYYLKTHIAHKPEKDTYLAYPANEPENTLVLKVFKSECLVPETTPADLRQMETRLRLLNHPHIVPTLELGIEQGKPYVVSAYMESGSLRRYLDQRSSNHLSLDEAVGVVIQVGQAVAFAHSHQILHLNITPEHIFLNNHGAVLLADFSLESLIHTSTQEDHIDLPTVNYRSPEQLLGNPSPFSDQYALGCLLYELATGIAPAPSSLWTHSHLTDQEKLSPLPHAIEAVMLRALEMKPQERYPDVAAFLDRLKATVQPRPPAFPFAHLTASKEEEEFLAFEPPLLFLSPSQKQERLSFLSSGIPFMAPEQKDLSEEEASIPDTSKIDTVLEHLKEPIKDKRKEDGDTAETALMDLLDKALTARSIDKDVLTNRDESLIAEDDEDDFTFLIGEEDQGEFMVSRDSQHSIATPDLMPLEIFSLAEKLPQAQEPQYGVDPSIESATTAPNQSISSVLNPYEQTNSIVEPGPVADISPWYDHANATAEPAPMANMSPWYDQIDNMSSAAMQNNLPGGGGNRIASGNGIQIATHYSQPASGGGPVRPQRPFTIPTLPDWKFPVVLVGVALVLTIIATLLAYSFNPGVLAAVKKAPLSIAAITTPIAIPTPLPTLIPTPLPTLIPTPLPTPTLRATPTPRAKPRPTATPRPKPTQPPAVSTPPPPSSVPPPPLPPPPPIPTPIPTPPPVLSSPRIPTPVPDFYTQSTSGTPIYSSSMARADIAGWDVIGSGGVSCGYTGSAYKITINVSSAYLPCQANNLRLSNFTFQVQMVITGPSGDGGGIVFRHNDNSEYRIRISTNGSYDLVATGYALLSGTSPYINTKLGQSNLLTVIASGANIYIYVNKHQIIHVNDTSSSGTFKLFAVDFSQTTTALFSNVKIWQK